MSNTKPTENPQPRPFRIKVLRNGAVTIPQKLRETMGLKPGDRFDWRIVGDRVVMTHLKA